MNGKPLLADTLEGPLLDRRAFLGNVSLAAGAAMASALVPLSFAGAAPVGTGSVLADAAAQPCGTGHVDDACGHWPPYAHPIPYGRPPAAPVTWANVDPIDRNFMV